MFANPLVNTIRYRYENTSLNDMINYSAEPSDPFAVNLIALPNGIKDLSRGRDRLQTTFAQLCELSVSPFLSPGYSTLHSPVKGRAV